MIQILIYRGDRRRADGFSVFKKRYEEISFFQNNLSYLLREVAKVIFHKIKFEKEISKMKMITKAQNGTTSTLGFYIQLSEKQRRKFDSEKESFIILS